MPRNSPYAAVIAAHSEWIGESEMVSEHPDTIRFNILSDMALDLTKTGAYLTLNGMIVHEFTSPEKLHLFLQSIAPDPEEGEPL